MNIRGNVYSSYAILHIDGKTTSHVSTTHISLRRCRFPVIIHFLNGKLLNVNSWKLSSFCFSMLSQPFQEMILIFPPSKNKMGAEIFRHRKQDRWCGLVVSLSMCVYLR